MLSIVEQNETPLSDKEIGVISSKWVGKAIKSKKSRKGEGKKEKRCFEHT